MRAWLTIYLISLPFIALSQQDVCSPNSKIQLKQDWAQLLIDLKINKLEYFMGPDSTGQNSVLLARFIRNTTGNSVWGEFSDRWGKVFQQTYYSFNKRNLIDTMLSFNADQTKINTSTYFSYDGDNQLIKKKLIYASGGTRTSKYSFSTIENGILKEHETYTDSLVFKASRYYSRDGKLIREKTDDFKSSLHFETFFFYDNEGKTIRETHLKNGDTTLKRIITKDGGSIDASFYFGEEDLIPEYFSTFDSQTKVRRSEYLDFEGQHQIVHCYFDEEMKLSKKLIEIVSIYRPQKIEIRYNQHELPISKVIHVDGKFWRAIHYKYTFE